MLSTNFQRIKLAQRFERIIKLKQNIFNSAQKIINKDNQKYLSQSFNTNILQQVNTQPNFQDISITENLQNKQLFEKYEQLIKGKQIINFSKEDDDKDQQGRKVSQGFEKFFKKDKKEQVKEDKKDQPSSKGSEKEEKKKEQDLSEEEDSSDKNNNTEKEEQKNQKLKGFFFEPNNNPKQEFWMALMALFSAGFFYYNYKKPIQEIVFQEFINNYVILRKIKQIDIVKDRRSEIFNHRAIITTVDGDQLYLVLNSVEQFLAKLDLLQREMGVQPHDYIPVKFTGNLEDSSGSNFVKILIMAFFVASFYQIFKGKGKGGMSTGKKIGKSSQDDKKKDGFFGGRGMNDMFGMGDSKAKQFGGEDGKKIKTRFRHVAGNEGAKNEIMEFVDFLKDPQKYQKLGARVPRGALLVGPPGTGKTLLAKAVAGESNVPFFTISGSDFVEMFVGVGASRVRDLFKKARAKAPSIIFIDEIDAVGKKRHGKMGGGNDERDNTLNQLLVEMDGFSTDTSVIVLAATNRADILDKALLRPGRFDRQVEVVLPTLEERAQIFKVHLKKIVVSDQFDKDQYSRKLAALTPGFSGADIQNICNEAAIIAARGNKDSVGIREFELATERVIAGIEKQMPKNEVQLRTVAYHEAGHAVAGWFSKHAAPLLKLTIIPRSKGSLGFAQYLPDEISLYTKDQLCDMITVALGGRISEEIFFNKITTGASDDIKKCQQIAQGIVCQYGMIEKLGAVNYSQEEGFQKPFSERTGKIIDDEIQKIIQHQYQECYTLLSQKKELIKELAERLLQKETISLPDIVDVLGPRPYPQKKSLLDYLEELRERTKEDIEAAQKAEALAADQLKIQEEEKANQQNNEQKTDKINEDESQNNKQDK